MSELKQQSKRGTGVALTATLIIIAISFWMILQRQYIHDQIIVWQYQPTSAIASIADRTTMTDKGRFFFYASRPTIEDNQAFNKNCSRLEQQTAILGCYRNAQIYIYNVKDVRLDGMLEVTAAHEMLHAAYVRLSSGERRAVDELLAAEYATLKSDAKFAERMAFYDRTEPGEQSNELFAIIGTEINSVSPQLEATYRRYFSDRREVVAMYQSYESVFTSLSNQAAELTDKLSALSDEISRDTAKYNQDVAALNTAIETFNQRAQGDGFLSQSQFQSERNALVARVDDVEALRAAINASIERYNALRIELESVSSQSQALNRSIDSTLAPAPVL